MEFKFDANQEFQTDAIDAVTELLDGQPRIEVNLEFSLGDSGFAAISNRIDLSEATLLKNLHAAQADNDISPDADLRTISELIETATGVKSVRFPNFSIEMETGTGKTYVYIRTIWSFFAGTVCVSLSSWCRRSRFEKACLKPLGSQKNT